MIDFLFMLILTELMYEGRSSIKFTLSEVGDVVEKEFKYNLYKQVQEHLKIISC